MYYKEYSKSFYKNEYHSKSANNYSNNSSRTTDNSTSKYQNSKYAPRKSFERKEYSNNSNNHYSKNSNPKYDKQEYTSTSRKYKSEATNPSHKKHSWNPEKDGEKRNERSFLDFIGIETDENIIAKRQFQIDAAKASFAYARYSMLVAKNQRITDMPQTPNKFMRTDTISWMQTVKKWVKQLRGWQLPGGPSLPSPVWIPEEKSKPNKSLTQPAREYESESSQERYRSKRQNYEKKIERKRKRSPTPSPPRTRTFTHNTQIPHAKYPRTSTHDTKYPSRGYTKKIHYEAFSNSEDFANNSPKLERKVSYVKDCGPRFTHSSRDEKQDLRYKMRQPHTRNNISTRKFEYRNESDRRSYTNISWSPDDSPVRQTHFSPYNRHGNMASLPRERETSPITPPLIRKELTPEFDIPGQQWEMENELVLLEDA